MKTTKSDLSTLLDALDAYIQPTMFGNPKINKSDLSEVFNQLEIIEFNLELIQRVQGNSQELYDRPKDEIIAEYQSSINEIVATLVAEIEDDPNGFDLEYKDKDQNRTILEFLESLGGEVKDRVIGAFVLPLVRKFCLDLSFGDGKEADRILAKNPKILEYLYKMPPSSEREDLILSITSGEVTLSKLEALSPKKRAFCLSAAAVALFYTGIINFDWLSNQTDDFLDFLYNKDIVTKLTTNGFSLDRIGSIFSKFGSQDAKTILDHAVDDEKDLDAWDSLSKEDLEKLRKFAGAELDYCNWKSSKVIGMFKENPRKFVVLSSARVGKIVSLSGYSREYFEELYDNDREKFSALTHPNMLTLLRFKDMESLTLLYDQNRLMFHFFTADNSIRIIDAIGFNDSYRLFAGNFHTFAAMYNLGERFQVVNYRQIPKLIQMREPEAALSPKIKMSVSNLMRFWVEVASLPTTVPPPPSPPVRSNSYIIQL